MLAVQIEIQTLEMAKEGHKLFASFLPSIDRLGKGEVHEAVPLSLGILESGMHSGCASVMLLTQFEVDGRVYFLQQQMSADMFKTLAAAVKGAEARFEDKAKEQGMN